MSKQANKTVIGIFVVGAIALAVVAIVVLGSGKFFKQALTAVCYFEGSVGGLNVGAPVVFRGVKIGSVKDVILRADAKTLAFVIPVYIEIEPDKISVVGARPKLGEHFKTFIDRGLRASLEMQSIVTGQMQVGLDFHPDKPAKFAGADTKIPEIPTIPTPMQELAQKIQKLPIEEIFDKLASALDGIDKVVKSPEIPEAIHSVNLALGDVRKLVKNVDGQVGPLASNLNDAVQDIRKLVQNADGTVNEVRGVVKNLDNRIGPLVTSIEKSIQSADATLTLAQKAIEKIEGAAGEDSTLVYELNKTLEEFHALARSVRVLADHIERHPESVLWGK
jgi:paraquat-inducible protein B